MRFLTWAILFVLFVLLLAFAAKNADPVTLRFYFDLALQAPLILLLFGFFATGAVLGLVAALGILFSQRREIARLKRIDRSTQTVDARIIAQPPPAEG